MTEESPQYKRPRRRWLRFGLRGLMLLVLLCSLPLAWLSQDVVRSQRETAVANRIRAAGGQVDYDYEENSYCFMGAPVEREPPGPKWVRNLLGQNIYASVTVVDLRKVDDIRPLLPLLPQLSKLHQLYLPDIALSPSLIEPLQQLQGLDSCNARFTQCTPEQLQQLAECSVISVLTLEESAATDEVLVVLPSFRRLPKLVLRHSNMTNTGLAYVSDIESLEELEIERALNINNDGIKHLVDLNKLHTLTLFSTYVTEGCIDSIAKMKSLTTLTIETGELDLKYYPWRCIRLDNYQPVAIHNLQYYDEEDTWVQCIRVYENRILFDDTDRFSLRPGEQYSPDTLRWNRNKRARNPNVAG